MREIIVVSGFSGSGKGTLLKALLEQTDVVEMVRSCTTRKRRCDEEFYTFVSEETFQKMYLQGMFLEANSYNGEYYGSPLTEVQRILGAGDKAILEIDVNGYRQILNNAKIPKDIIRSIFITARPDELLQRLVGRGTETKESIVRRLKSALSESESVMRYDYVIHNAVFEEALKDLKAFVAGENTKRQKSLFDVEIFKSELEYTIDHLDDAL